MLSNLCKNIHSVARNFYHFFKYQSVVLEQACLVQTLPRVRFQHQSVISDPDEIELEESREVVAKVNDEIHNKSHGRLFAVIQLCGKQFKITDEDLIMVEGRWAPMPGDKIRLEKVLLVGSANFTLIGRPLLPKDQVSVYATIIEKFLSPTILHFVKIRRKGFKRLRLSKYEQTIIRITSIDIHEGVNESSEVDGTRDRIF